MNQCQPLLNYCFLSALHTSTKPDIMLYFRMDLCLMSEQILSVKTSFFFLLIILICNFRLAHLRLTPHINPNIAPCVCF